jgi:hypothetical protein
MSGMRAPVSGESTRLDVELIPAGMQLCTLYGLACMGEQTTNFGESQQINLMFEFPQHMRIFTEGGDPKPAGCFTTQTYSMNKKANLRKNYVELMHRVMTDDEAADFDIGSLLTKSFVATIVHSSDGKYANIQSITPLTEQNKGLFQLESTIVEQINNTQYFDLSQRFDSENFGQLPNFIKTKIKESKEGRAHALSGGVFAEYVKTESSSSQASVGSGGKKLEMINADVPYNAFIEQGWTDETLVEHGHAKWIVAVAPTAPTAPSAAVTPAAPIVPTAVNTALPSVPVAVAPVHVPKLTLNDPAQTLADWISAGWTEAQIISEGHGKLV